MGPAIGRTLCHSTGRTLWHCERAQAGPCGILNEATAALKPPPLDPSRRVPTPTFSTPTYNGGLLQSVHRHRHRYDIHASSSSSYDIHVSSSSYDTFKSRVNLIAGRLQHAHVFIWVPRATCVLTGGGGGGRIHRFSAVFKKAAEYRSPGASQAGQRRNIGLCKRKNAGIREVAAKLQGRAGMKCYEQARRVGRCRALILLSCCLFVVLVSCSVRASLAHSVWRPGESPSRSPMTVK
jgi:hypothetical protein